MSEKRDDGRVVRGFWWGALVAAIINLVFLWATSIMSGKARADECRAPGVFADAMLKARQS